ncbi:hypothetical protein KM800_14045 [Clostridium tyrobutyricum]|uniref:hypothetical protein n=1 Tax=Clostridium tyrobutyricum TaxID=1519 RepID=UPI001C37FCE2|nr:hypothetical protein [Clostridium tyrobutyricum]MBV4420428.1 hypothetical protein [Clostridium tyrobutyricum]
MIKTRTKIVIPVCVVLAILIAFSVKYFNMSSGSGSFNITRAIELNTKNSMKMYYHSFSGNKYTSLKLKKGDKLILNVSVTTKQGNLKVSLNNGNNKELFSTENPKKTVTKTININENDNYRLKVSGKHKGSFYIKWRVES